MAKAKERISFIIPALNEEINIGGVIDSIKRNVDGRYEYELIVVDNGSADQTVEIAGWKGAVVLQKPGLTIAAMRNRGAAFATGEVIVFLDADVFLDNSWGDAFRNAIELLKTYLPTVTGSIYGINEKTAGLIEKNWFYPILKKKNPNYINGGHLILLKESFDKIGGFREDLETGEDYDFCKRARHMGAKIINNPELKVIHEGYPKTIMAFFRRERWHGRGDFKTFRSILSSKPALVSLCQLALLIMGVFATVLSGNLLIVLLYILEFGAFCIFASAYRCGVWNSSFPFCILMYGIYFIARTFSFVDVVLEKLYEKFCRNASGLTVKH